MFQKLGLGTVLLQSQSDQMPEDNATDFIPTDLQSVAYVPKSLTTAEENYAHVCPSVGTHPQQ